MKNDNKPIRPRLNNKPKVVFYQLGLFLGFGKQWNNAWTGMKNA
jgi:hypothetical protein